MPCSFCDSENTEVVGYCYHCKTELCEKHYRIGRNGVYYCLLCDSKFYKEMDSFIKKMKAVSKERKISKNKMKEIIVSKVNEWK